MSQNKTQANKGDVNAFLAGIENDTRRQDALTLLALFSRVTKEPAVMWGASIVGFGQYSYQNSKGPQSFMLTGFSPRKQNSTLYVMQGFDAYAKDLAAIGKVKHAKSCLYISRLANINMDALERFLVKVVIDMRKKYPSNN